MKSYLVRGEGSSRDTVSALALGVLVGATGYYLARILLAKRTLPQGPPEGWSAQDPAVERAEHRRLPGRKGAGGPQE